MPRFKSTKKTFSDRTGYDNRLLTPGFGGELGPDELEALRKELLRRPGLRERWRERTNYKEKDSKSIIRGD